jgi:hypothetical protein
VPYLWPPTWPRDSWLKRSGCPCPSLSSATLGEGHTRRGGHHLQSPSKKCAPQRIPPVPAKCFSSVCPRSNQHYHSYLLRSQTQRSCECGRYLVRMKASPRHCDGFACVSRSSVVHMNGRISARHQEPNAVRQTRSPPSKSQSCPFLVSHLRTDSSRTPFSTPFLLSIPVLTCLACLISLTFAVFRTTKCPVFDEIRSGA